MLGKLRGKLSARDVSMEPSASVISTCHIWGAATGMQHSNLSRAPPTADAPINRTIASRNAAAHRAHYR
jgi:hypothetical protein